MSDLNEKGIHTLPIVYEQRLELKRVENDLISDYVKDSYSITHRYSKIGRIAFISKYRKANFDGGVPFNDIVGLLHSVDLDNETAKIQLYDSDVTEKDLIGSALVPRIKYNESKGKLEMICFDLKRTETIDKENDGHMKVSIKTDYPEIFKKEIEKYYKMTGENYSIKAVCIKEKDDDRESGYRVYSLFACDVFAIIDINSIDYEKMIADIEIIGNKDTLKDDIVTIVPEILNGEHFDAAKLCTIRLHVDKTKDKA